MSKYLISFPASAMNIPASELSAVSEASHKVIREAKQAGVYVFGGGINEAVAPLMVTADGSTRTKPIHKPKNSTAAFAC